MSFQCKAKDVSSVVWFLTIYYVHVIMGYHGYNWPRKVESDHNFALTLEYLANFAADLPSPTDVQASHVSLHLEYWILTHFFWYFECACSHVMTYNFRAMYSPQPNIHHELVQAALAWASEYWMLNPWPPSKKHLHQATLLLVSHSLIMTMIWKLKLKVWMFHWWISRSRTCTAHIFWNYMRLLWTWLMHVQACACTFI